MKKRRLFACLMAGAMVFTVAACGNTSDSAGEPETEVVEAPADEAFSFDATASIDFSDGKFAFLGSDYTVNPVASETLIELVDKEGRKAVKVNSSDNGKMYVAIQMDALLGDCIGDVASVEFDLETEQGETFFATSGNIYHISGDEQEILNAWSIYLENKNPKHVSAELSGATDGDFLVISLEDSGAGVLDDAILYIFTISFKDASGNVIPVDTSAEYVSSDVVRDRNHLFGITGAVTIDGVAGKGEAWKQVGNVDIPEDVLEILSTPGSVVEITYSSKSGNMWMGLSGENWTRIGVGDLDESGQGYSYYNDARNIAQIPYETIIEVAGDPSTWDKQIFVESDSDFEVFSVKVGMQAPNYDIADALDTGSAGVKNAWAQVDIALTDEEFAMLTTPGSIVKVEYKSEDGDCWIGMNGNGSQGGWFRVGIGTAGDDTETSVDIDAITDGSVCYVTFDMIDTICKRKGVEEPEKWANHIYVESDTPFEVYAVYIGKAVLITPDNGHPTE